MKVYISATLRGFFGRNPQLDIDAKDINGLLEALTGEYPDSKKILFEEDGALRSFIRIYVGGTDRTDKKFWSEEVPSDKEVLLLPAIAGGAPGESIISDERRKEVSLDDSEIERFGKHLMLREISVKGQKRIKAARVVVAGAGALAGAAH